MCSTCGCSDPEQKYSIRKPGEGINLDHHEGVNGHHHGDHHQHENETGQHHHTHSHERVIEVEQDILQRNNLLAERNRGYFEAKNITTFNLVSSPGSGKTALLEKTITALFERMEMAVIEGDQQTMNDADRIKAAGAPAIQINTGMGCHLDAAMVNQATKELNPKNDSVLFIENVGNLVCPSLFDLGEFKRVVIMSVTEGEDKPLKYPHMFKTSQLCIINKIDLAPYVDFDLKKVKAYLHQVNHHLDVIAVSVKTGEGLNEWYQWLESHLMIQLN